MYPPLQVDMLFDKSSLSPYIRFGCLSVRFLLQKVKWYSQSRPSMEKVAKELTFKLLQREFFFIVSAQVREREREGEGEGGREGGGGWLGVRESVQCQRTLHIGLRALHKD